LKQSWKKLLICIAIPLAVGGLSAWLTGDGMEQFAALQKPPLSPPAWLFPVVWTILYILMGVASWLVCTSETEAESKKYAIRAYGLQLILNFFWSILFFGFSLYLIAFIWLLLLWMAVYVTILRFAPISKLAGELLLPYLLWITFAGYLNFTIYLLN